MPSGEPVPLTQLQNLGELGAIAQKTGAEVAQAVNKSFLASAEAWRETVTPADAVPATAPASKTKAK